MHTVRARAALTLVAAASSLFAASCAGDPAAADPFTKLPVACDLVSQATTMEIVGAASGETGSTTDGIGSCRWQYRAAEAPEPQPTVVAPYRRELHLSVYLHQPSEGADATGVDLAKDVFRLGRQDEGMDGKGDVSGVGDEAYLKEGGRFGKLTFREGNVTVQVRYEGMGTGPDGSAAGLGQQAVSDALMKAAKEASGKLGS